MDAKDQECGYLDGIVGRVVRGGFAAGSRKNDGKVAFRVIRSIIPPVAKAATRELTGLTACWAGTLQKYRLGTVVRVIVDPSVTDEKNPRQATVVSDSQCVNPAA